MTSMRPSLILNSDRAPSSESLAEIGPRRDFLLLSRSLDDAPIRYAPAPSKGLIGVVERRSASDIRQALSAFACRRQVGAFVSLSEKVGIPLALVLGRRGTPPHVLVAHHVTSEKKRALQRRTNYLQRFARIVVICRSQERYLIDEARIPAERVRLIDYRVDEDFWSASEISGGETTPASKDGRMILSVGRERRDYETLARAAKLLPQHSFTIVASSPWSRGAGDTPIDVPPNVEVRRNLSWVELRGLYEAAAIVVVPLISGTAYGAGLTAMLEAMAMGKPLIVTQTPGIANYVEDNFNARVIAADDPARMAAAVLELTENVEVARRFGDAARQSVTGRRNLNSYVSALAETVITVLSNIE